MSYLRMTCGRIPTGHHRIPTGLQQVLVWVEGRGGGGRAVVVEGGKGQREGVGCKPRRVRRLSSSLRPIVVMLLMPCGQIMIGHQ